jgi:plasmid stability protein
MSALLIEDLPEPLHLRLKARAARRGRTVEAEALWILERATDERPTPTLAEIDALRVRGATPLTQALIDAARMEGRPSSSPTPSSSRTC